MDMPAAQYSNTFAIYQAEFLNHYNGNRAPFGLYLHALPFVKAAKDEINRFLEYALDFPDVWVITVTELLDFMLSPMTKEQYATMRASLPCGAPSPSVSPSPASMSITPTCSRSPASASPSRSRTSATRTPTPAHSPGHCTVRLGEWADCTSNKNPASNQCCPFGWVCYLMETYWAQCQPEGQCTEPYICEVLSIGPPSFSPSISISPSLSESSSISLTPSVTSSISITSSITPTISITPSITPTVSITASSSPTISITSSISKTSFISPSTSRTSSASPIIATSGATSAQQQQQIKTFIQSRKGYATIGGVATFLLLLIGLAVCIRQQCGRKKDILPTRAPHTWSSSGLNLVRIPTAGSSSGLNLVRMPAPGSGNVELRVDSDDIDEQGPRLWHSDSNLYIRNLHIPADSS
eukprot:g32152.t1